LISEYTPLKDLSALKYGREMEGIALAFYLEILIKKDVKHREFGLFIHQTKHFLRGITRFFSGIPLLWKRNPRS